MKNDDYKIELIEKTKETHLSSKQKLYLSYEIYEKFIKENTSIYYIENLCNTLNIYNIKFCKFDNIMLKVSFYENGNKKTKYFYNNGKYLKDIISNHIANIENIWR